MRSILTKSLALAALALGAASPALAQQAAPAAPAAPGDWQYSASYTGTPHYQPGFTHFDYVNVNAPKGGTVKISSINPTYDTVNPILPKGVAADGIGLVYEELTTSSLDEADIGAQYPDISDKWRTAPDASSVTYHINPKAKWQDGTPVTAQDVVWSFNTLIKLNPSQANYYSHVKSAAVTGDGNEVTFTFDEVGDTELPMIVGQVLVLPQHWWEGKDASGKARDISQGTLEPLMGSGPYKMGAVVAGRSISYLRDKTYWGAAEPENVGTYNFDEVDYEYYRDLDVSFEAFKAGEFDYWSENQASRWATGYDFPALKAGKVTKEVVTLGRDYGVMVGFIPNLRRPLFQDLRVRRALNLVYDFEQVNHDLYYDQYQRINSFFFGLSFAAKGLPTGQELDILNSVKAQVPPEVFTTEYKNPINGDPQKVRDNLKMALDLLTAAGFKLQGNTLLDPSGKPFTFEIMFNNQTVADRAGVPFAQSLAKIGITANIRTVDPSQFVTRERSRDFDMMYNSWVQSSSPGNEQLDFWGSVAADQDGSANYVGIKNPAVDTIINRIIYAKDRDEQLAAVSALDRVLLWNQYVIPSYTILNDRIAYWNKFGHPDPYPKFTEGFPTVWWYDAAKAAKTAGG